MAARVGTGFDAHPLADGRRLVLGGVEIPFHKGLSGHSDGDVLTHALMDALLGAVGLGDKGTHFPSTDPLYKDASSLGLLSTVGDLVRDSGCRISNVDATMLAQNPVLGPYIRDMKERIANALEIDQARVSIKATTTDQLGFVGREEGMAAYAVALVESIP